MATILEWLEGGEHLDAAMVLSYRSRASRPDGQQWADLHHVGPLTNIPAFVAWRANATPAESDQPRAPNPPKQQPQTLIQRTTTLAAVLADTARRKIETGVAFITEDQILARVAICRECDQFDPVKESCKLCGCGCSGASKLANKLAHHASQCPHDPPKWVAIP